MLVMAGIGDTVYYYYDYGLGNIMQQCLLLSPVTMIIWVKYAG